MRFTKEGQRGTVRLTAAGVRSEVHRRVREALLGSLWQESGVRFTEEGQRGTVRLTVAGVRRYGVRFTVAGVRSEVHRGGSERHC